MTQLLAAMFGKAFYSLNDLEQMIVVTAAIEGWVNHERACQLTSKHSRDVTLTLPHLVDKGFLVASGEKKDKSYSLPGMEPPSPEDVFSNALTSVSNLTHKEHNLTHNGKKIDNENDCRDDKGRYISALIDKPFIDSLEVLSEQFRQQLNALSVSSREQHRLDTETMKSLIIALCRGHYISVSVLEMLLDRKPQSLRQNYLKPMVSEGRLKMAFPNKPNSPKQGYTSTGE